MKKSRQSTSHQSTSQKSTSHQSTSHRSTSRRDLSSTRTNYNPLSPDRNSARFFSPYPVLNQG
jgi:hypothetical protein